MAKAVRKSFLVSGKVQGVFFRKYTQAAASLLGLTGFVMNRPDRSVYLEAQGDAALLQELESWLHQGSPMSKVSSVEVKELPLQPAEKDFIVRHF